MLYKASIWFQHHTKIFKPDNMKAIFVLAALIAAGNSCNLVLPDPVANFFLN